MKKIALIFILILIYTNALLATVTVDGFCYLNGETNNSGTKILFSADSPSAVTDTSFTDNSGYFSIGLSPGIYDIVYSHDSRLSYSIDDVFLMNDTTLDSVTLYFGLNGSLSGTLVGGYDYHVTASISVNNGDSLIIEPGVTVSFMGNYSFTIYGKLVAVGTENDSVLFTSGQATHNPDDWDQILFENNSDDNSIISYAKIEYADIGIHCYSSPTLSNNTISNNYYGILCYYSSPTISNNKISNHHHDGIYCRDSSPSISNNTISINNAGGIYCYLHSSPTISNNTIINNNNYGIRCNNDSSPSISSNIIYDNSTGIGADSSPSSVEYNLFWLNTTDGSGNLPPYFGQIITVNANGDSCDTYYNLFMDPLFVNPDTLDFHLTEDSPCIDAGDPNSPLDPDGTIADMGAYYFDQSGIIYPPTSNFSADTTTGFAPLTVNFTDQSTPGTGTIVEWKWYFGDGDSSSVQNPTWEYINPRNYTVSLTVTDEYDSTATETKVDYITVFPVPPTADFVADTTSGYAPLTVNFADQSTQGTGAIIEWKWYFGDEDSSSVQNPTYIYQSPGTYTVSLTVTDEYDSTATETKVDYITVFPVPPTADFTADITSGFAPLTVNFTDQSTQGTGAIEEWYWDFDYDGTIDSYEQNPEWIYNQAGIYTVSLMVTDVNDSTDTEIKEDYITVYEGIIVDGYCFLDGETNHSDTKVLFEAVTPSAITDSAYTNIDGSFLIGLSEGVYTVHYSHEGWQPYTIPGEIMLFEDTTLDPVNLQNFPIEVSGPQSGIWTSDYTYQVVGDISVSNGDTLIIEPGVTVKFMDYYSFTIYGKLLAAGTENDTILFSSGQLSCNPDDWNQIKFESDSDSNSVISYSTIEYAKYGIWCNYSSPTVSNNSICSNNNSGIYCYESSPTITNNSIFNNSSGISCSNESSPTISNNSICNNSNGIFCHESSPTINNNSISNINSGISCYSSSSPNIGNNMICSNFEFGIVCSDSSPIIINNSIWNNNNYGIYCGDNSSPSIINNLIFDNNDVGIYCYSNSSPTISNNSICNNNCGIYCSGSPIILNNILYDNYGYGIHASSTPSTLDYNLFWLNGNACYGNGTPQYFGQIVTVNANSDSCDTYYNLFMDPLFVNPDSLDFHLTQNSPCIDAGDPNSTPDPDGTIADMGAYYFDQSGIIYPPTADFSADTTSGFAPLIVNFTDQSTQGTGAIEEWQWDFDNDGTIDSYEQNPQWIYNNPGTYTVSLTVTDEYDSTDTETKIDYINVFGTVSTPTFDPPGGIYPEPQYVKILCPTLEATIHYTLDGSEPDETSLEYTDSIFVDFTKTIKARAYKQDWIPSQIAVAHYNITGTVAQPTFNPVEGIYTEPQTVEISTTTSGATIHYTLDGIDPNETSPEYIEPIFINISIVIKAKAYKQNWLSSQIATANYTITGTVTAPTFHPTAGFYPNPIFVKILCNIQDAVIYYTQDGSNPDETSLAYTDSILVDTSLTIKARAYKQDWVTSQIAIAHYIIQETAPHIEVDPDSLSFGNVTIGETSVMKSFLIFNQGNEELLINEISAPQGFQIKKGIAGDWTESISTFVIPESSFQKIYVKFMPTNSELYEGHISILSNDPDEDTVFINVSGAGVEYTVPNIEIDPSEIPFGNITILSTKEEFFTISNTGTAELIIDSIYVPVNSGFMIRSGDSGEYSNFISGFTISQGNEQIIYVEFIPHVVGYYSAYISISSNAGDGNDFVFVSGTGVEYDVPDIDVNPVELHFGGVPIYQSVEDTITIMNTGNAILEINNIFSLSGYEIKLDDESWGNHIPAFDIPPLGEEIIYVKFHPEALITYNGVIYITSNDPDEGSIPVLVEGQGIPVLSEIIPDAFTPNGDGLNDEFIIGPFQESGGDIAKFIIYDILGKILHETDGGANIPLTWDGNDNSGNKCISGAYIYVYLINDKVYKRGKIYLIR